MTQVRQTISVPRPFRSPVLSNDRIARGFFRLTLASPPGLARPTAGQFVHIRVSDSYVPLLRRPFSLYDATSSELAIVYRVVGKGTEELSRVLPGAELDVFGPLGNGFVASSATKQHILVGGGVGVAPLVLLAKTIASQSPDAIPNIRFIAGFRCSDDAICVDFPGKLHDIALTLRTEDGTKGEPGLVHTALVDFLKTEQLLDSSAVYACGPRPMLREIARIGARYGVPTQVLMEEVIACGVGVCQGCVVGGVEGYLRVCRDGPVFDASLIDWSDGF